MVQIVPVRNRMRNLYDLYKYHFNYKQFRNGFTFNAIILLQNFDHSFKLLHLYLLTTLQNEALICIMFTLCWLINEIILSVE